MSVPFNSPRALKPGRVAADRAAASGSTFVGAACTRAAAFIGAGAGTGSHDE
jgi:hypothetical protein